MAAESRLDWLRRYLVEHAEEIEAAPRLQLTFNFGAGEPNAEFKRFDRLKPPDCPQN